MIREKITFGLELECVKLTNNASGLMQHRGFSRHYDASIRGPNGEHLPPTIEAGGGSELVTPVYNVEIDSDDEGKKMQLNYGDAMERVRDLCACAAEVNTSCGLHIHLGRPGANNRSTWKPEHVRSWLAIGLILEERLFRMVPPSRRNNQTCLPIKQRFMDTDLQSFYPTGNVAPRKCDNPKRYCWLNLIETRRQGTDPTPGRMASTATGTIEIRMLGCTRRFEYIWAWTQLWSKIGAYIAYMSPTFALMHCGLTDSIATELEAVLRAKNADEESSVVAAAAAPNIAVPPATTRGVPRPPNALRGQRSGRLGPTGQTVPRVPGPYTSILDMPERARGATPTSALDVIRDTPTPTSPTSAQIADMATQVSEIIFDPVVFDQAIPAVVPTPAPAITVEPRRIRRSPRRRPVEETTSEY
jgi:hypothetical protein